MWKRLIQHVLKGRPVEVPGTDGIQEGHARSVTIGDLGAGGLQVLLCRIDGRLHAIDTLCPHEGGRMVSGPLADGRHAVCPLHNFAFDPRSGRVVRGACRKARVFRVDERDGAATIWT